MSWSKELAEWLADGPRPHQPPGGATSVYGWLKEHGEQILADAGRIAEQRCAVKHCTRAAVHFAAQQRRRGNRTWAAWLKRCAGHTPEGAETRPL